MVGLDMGGKSNEQKERGNEAKKGKERDNVDILKSILLKIALLHALFNTKRNLKLIQ
jgi:hypothetical protein